MELITTIVKLLESVLLNTYTFDQEKEFKKYYGQYVMLKIIIKILIPKRMNRKFQIILVILQ